MHNIKFRSSPAQHWTARRQFGAVLQVLEPRRLCSGYTLSLGPVLSVQATATPVLDAAGNEFVANYAGNLYEIAHGSTTATLLASGAGYPGPNGLAVDASDDLFYVETTIRTSDLYELPVGGSTPQDLGSVGNGEDTPVDFPLVVDASGNVYGTAPDNGPDADGSVFEWSPSTGTLSTLATFDGADGAGPSYLAVNVAGNVYGITTHGGSGTTAGTTGVSTGPGTVFEITKGNGTVTSLATFTTSTVGEEPGGSIALDANGNVYGTDVGNGNNGIIWELHGSTGTISDLYNFTGADDGSLTGGALTGVVADSSGDLFGISFGGWPNGSNNADLYGTVYEVARWRVRRDLGPALTRQCAANHLRPGRGPFD